MNQKPRALPGSTAHLQLIDHVEEVPTPSRMQVTFLNQNKDRATVQFKDPIDLPEGYYVVVDMGRLNLKAGCWKEGVFYIDKLSTTLAEIDEQIHEVQKVSKTDFMARNNAKRSAKNKLTITYLNKTYTIASRAQKLGGKQGLGEKKTVHLLERILSVLTLYNIKEGDVNLILTIPYEGINDWETQVAVAKKQLNGNKIWKSEQGTHDVNIKSAVFPESYFAEQFPRLCSDDYPNWEEMNHYVIDFGYQTLIQTAFVYDNGLAFEPDLSRCFDGYGLSRFYQYVAQEAGIEDPEDTGFINAVNYWDSNTQVPSVKIVNGEKVFFIQENKYRLTSPITMARKQYLEDIFGVLKFAKTFNHFQVVGGGAYLFGEAFSEEYNWADSFIVDLPDLCNVIGAGMSFADTFEL